LITSFQIANDYFPFGTGLGTFASYFSTVNYSPIYFLYGLSNVNGLRLNATNFASDSFWPMIIGQSGWIGFIAYVVAVIMLFIAIQKLYKINLSFYAAALIGLIYVLIASMAEAAFVHPVVIPLAAMIGFMLSQKDKEKEEGLMFNEKRVVVIYKQKCTVC
jgi:hypothetical protein